jgi:hypothetical protein
MPMPLPATYTAQALILLDPLTDTTCCASKYPENKVNTIEVLQEVLRFVDEPLNNIPVFHLLV